MCVDKYLEAHVPAVRGPRRPVLSLIGDDAELDDCRAGALRCISGRGRASPDGAGDGFGELFRVALRRGARKLGGEQDLVAALGSRAPGPGEPDGVEVPVGWGRGRGKRTANRVQSSPREPVRGSYELVLRNRAHVRHARPAETVGHGRSVLSREVLGARPCAGDDRGGAPRRCRPAQAAWQKPQDVLGKPLDTGAFLYECEQPPCGTESGVSGIFRMVGPRAGVGLIAMPTPVVVDADGNPAPAGARPSESNDYQYVDSKPLYGVSLSGGRWSLTPFGGSPWSDSWDLPSADIADGRAPAVRWSREAFSRLPPGGRGRGYASSARARSLIDSSP